jgi:hypothetical protein
MEFAMTKPLDNRGLHYSKDIILGILLNALLVEKQSHWVNNWSGWIDHSE